MQPTTTDPNRFDDYIVSGEPLGQGTYGRTYLVHHRNDTSHETPLALKWLWNPEKEGAESRFTNESWALQHLDHRAFPKYISEGYHQGRPYIVMSYAEGRTVEDRVDENIKNQSFSSGLSVLLIAEHLLDAIIYLKSKDLIHRDIKDANVIVSSSGTQVTLIDLGLCKGPILPAQGQTFWNAGAARFAPPSKLENPANSIVSHDVFAIGVLSYHMLTNRYPWEVEQSKAAGDLKHEMLSRDPIPIQEINRAIDERIANLVYKMLDVQDWARIAPEAAREEVSKLRNALEDATLSRIRSGPPLRLSRVVRDPLHGDIRMTDLEFAILNSREMQRLRWIRQLGTTHLVYPGAEHSRLSHALGVTYVVEHILKTIEAREGHLFSDANGGLRDYAL